MMSPVNGVMTMWRLLVGAGAAGLLAGCVSEQRAPQPDRPSPASPLPGGAIARPAGALSVSHVRVAVKPLGTVAYDGVTLPLVSPDARFIAVQEGTAPSWPALLAADDAVTPLAAAIAVYDITQAPIRRVGFAEEPPAGLVLGRAADDEGFLVEWPRPEGGRWIGKVAWASGRVSWLVQGDAVNAHGVLTTAGELLYARRAVGAASNELVLRRRDGREIVRTTGMGSYLFPMATADPAAAYVIVATEGGLELEAIGLVREPSATSPARWGATLARANVSGNNERAMAYQLAAPVQGTGALWRRGDAGDMPEPLAMYHPRMERMAALDKRTGVFTPLAEKSIAAAWWGAQGERGFFCTAPEGLVFTRHEQGAEMMPDASQRRAPDVRVLGGAYVPRVTANNGMPFVLLGPSRADPGRIEVAGMMVVREAE
jgi:hypothetical protein